jgi:glycine/D-amino acid oxidase-like deaminating enzyme
MIRTFLNCFVALALALQAFAGATHAASHSFENASVETTQGEFNPAIQADDSEMEAAVCVQCAGAFANVLLAIHVAHVEDSPVAHYGCPLVSAIQFELPVNIDRPNWLI